MEFIEIKKLLQDNFKSLVKEEEHLFEISLDKDELWDLYQDSFPEGTNEIFRERRQHDCSCCRGFIKGIGNAVVIKDNKIKTIWDFDTKNPTYQVVFNELDKFVKSHAVAEVYVNKLKTVGSRKNFEELDDGTILEWNHFHLEMPTQLIDRSKLSVADIAGTYRDTRNVFKRSLDELSEDSLLTVLELINQNSLYKGEEWKQVLETFLKYKQAYSKLTEQDKENYAWEQSVKISGAMGRIRNHSIGTLLIDITEGMDLDTAVKRYEKIVAPSNYKRPKAIYTKKMLEDAQNKVKELGYGDSLHRRFAKLDDIKINDILFSNKDSAKRMSGMDVFDEMKEAIPVNPKKFSRVDEISIDKFVEDVLPNAEEIEVLLENKHVNNMVSLIAPQNKNAKSMFKWDNPFSWAYTGNITDSDMRERVKSAGGDVDGELRFSIQWNDEEDYDKNDLDAHAYEPSGNLIYFGNKNNYATTGELDVDIIYPEDGVPAVENITWSNRDKMLEGEYELIVHNYSYEGGKNGFKAEIEFDGKIHSFDYNQTIKNKEEVKVAIVTFDREKGFTIKENLSSNLSTRSVWGVETNQFVPVSVVMNSPNYWVGQHGVGHRHYFFMLKDCVNPEKPNPFFNEFLKEELSEHRRVFEALGSRLAVEDVEDQLSGLGFSATKRSDVIVKIKGQVERILKIKF